MEAEMTIGDTLPGQHSMIKASRLEKSIATVCISGSLSEKLHAIAAAGFDSVEIFENDMINSTEGPEAIGNLIDSLGLKVSMYQPFRDFEGMPRSRFVSNMHRLETKFKLMRSLNTNLLLICSNVSNECLDDEDLIVSDLRAASDLAAKYGMRIAYEALSWGKYVNRWQQSWEIAKRVDRENIGICLDT